MYSQKPSVLACVTGQYDCDRIIREAARLADEYDHELRVISVLEPTGDYTMITGEIEYLDAVAKSNGADLTLLFHKDAAGAVAGFAEENGVARIVTGMHDGGDRSFLVRFNELAPAVSITMVDRDCTAYTMDVRARAIKASY